MSIQINGSGTITGVSVGGLPDGIVDTDMLATNAITIPKIGYAGAILQVISATKSNTSSVTGYSWTDTGLSVSITPSSSSNKILVLADMNLGGSVMYDIKLRLLRGSTAIGLGDTDGTRPRATRVVNSHVPDNYGIYQNLPATIVYLDSPSTTSATTYKIQFASYGTNVAWLNRSNEHQEDATNSEYDGTPASFITVMEVSG